MSPRTIRLSPNNSRIHPFQRPHLVAFHSRQRQGTKQDEKVNLRDFSMRAQDQKNEIPALNFKGTRMGIVAR